MSDVTPPKQLPGPSGRRTMLRFFCVPIGTSIALALWIAASRQWLTLAEAEFGIILIGIIGLTVGVLLLRQVFLANSREMAAGYVTWGAGGGEYWLLNDRTGEVIRPPGAPSTRPTET